ncbi:hypothetical protein BofuT4_uP092900.1 [Botrytis cinerea T4]|uniref:Uncharacterized protein n=1 Tax=Botryotinia fuckeliana (strain T4) TaxID=999810 RepID=G2YE20_BOTF4|nr:hypothetical protein BofuT4_uP092900.1 [Botrytis cinerea T4]
MQEAYTWDEMMSRRRSGELEACLPQYRHTCRNRKSCLVISRTKSQMDGLLPRGSLQTRYLDTNRASWMG